MPFEITSSEDDSIVTTRYFGRLVGDDILDAYLSRYSDPARIKKYRFVIADYSDVTETLIDGVDVVRLAWIVLDAARINPHVVLVSIMPEDLQFGLGRMWQGYTAKSPWKISVVRTKAEAESWIEKHKNLRSNQAHTTR